MRLHFDRMGKIGLLGSSARRLATLSALAVAGCLGGACESSSDEADDDTTVEPPTDDTDDETASDDAETDDAETDDTAADEPATDDTAESDDDAETDPSTPSGPADGGEEADAGTDSEPSEPEPEPQSPSTPTTDVMIECEELSYSVTCDDTQSRQGYYACSDYFGEILGVKETCSAGPNVDVRESPPCGEYEYPVGSCIYYNEALSDRCYITHVGAESADLVEAGQAFWEATCAGTWVAPD